MAGALKARIDSDLKAALLGGDRFKSDNLRNLKAAILNEEVALNERTDGLGDDSIEKVIAREVKKRNESASLYDQAGRPELADNERKEIEVISVYMPTQLSEADIKATVDRIVAGLEVSGPAAMGQAIGKVKAELGNAADGATIARLVKESLQ